MAIIDYILEAALACPVSPIYSQCLLKMFHTQTGRGRKIKPNFIHDSKYRKKKIFVEFCDPFFVSNIKN